MFSSSHLGRASRIGLSGSEVTASSTEVSHRSGPSDPGGEWKDPAERDAAGRGKPRVHDSGVLVRIGPDLAYC